MVRISKLHDDIGRDCVFEKVFLATVNGFENGGVIRFGLYEQYPDLDVTHLRIRKETGELIKDY